MKVARSTYYLQKTKEQSAREKENELLKAQILDIWTKHNSCYGTKKVRNEILKQYAICQSTNKKVAYHRVRRLMRELGISGIVVNEIGSLSNVGVGEV